MDTAGDAAVKMTRTIKDIMRTAHLQKELLRAAVDANQNMLRVWGGGLYHVSARGSAFDVLVHCRLRSCVRVHAL